MFSSIKKRWSHDATSDIDLDRQRSNAGAPPLGFTSARKRILFQLVTKSVVPFKYLPAVLHEDATNSEPEFSPCLRSCRNYWEEITPLKPGEVKIKEKKKRDKLKARLVRAFHKYQQQQEDDDKLSTTNIVPLSTPSQDSRGKSFDGSETTTIRAPKSSTDSARETKHALPVAVSTPALCFGGLSPASFQFAPTPGDTQNLDLGVIDETFIPDQDAHDGSTVFSNAEPRKRLAPAGFVNVSSSSRRRILNSAREASGQQYPLWASPSDMELHSGSTDTFPVVNPSTSAKLEPEKNVAEIEDELHYPRGFLEFLKKKLPRMSIQSMLSSNGTLRSRFSARRGSGQSGQSADEYYNPFPYSARMSSYNNLDRAEKRSRGFETGRATTTLIDELRLDGVPDQEIARRIEIMLKDFSYSRTRSIVRGRNFQGETALEVALALGNVPACNVLLENGADVYAKTSKDTTLSEFGRNAMVAVRNNESFFRIGICRTLILGHSPTKSSSGSKSVPGALTKRSVKAKKSGASTNASSLPSESFQCHKQPTPQIKSKEKLCSPALVDHYPIPTVPSSQGPFGPQSSTIPNTFQTLPQVDENQEYAMKTGRVAHLVAYWDKQVATASMTNLDGSKSDCRERSSSNTFETFVPGNSFLENKPTTLSSLSTHKASTIDPIATIGQSARFAIPCKVPSLTAASVHPIPYRDIGIYNNVFPGISSTAQQHSSDGNMESQCAFPGPEQSFNAASCSLVAQIPADGPWPSPQAYNFESTVAPVGKEQSQIEQTQLPSLDSTPFTDQYGANFVADWDMYLDGTGFLFQP
ncbi:hypothetical protein BP5796_02735 [Coleophoma crateriformis]|uniref:Uncharacterized protein n=1 Tax=Coleophoma crateriformis TaxID=565419 RepID=A0A3D8SZ59_9HELO|nr:hypothetical protein BP5796_02735 [Coleophoma crateriformis]